MANSSKPSDSKFVPDVEMARRIGVSASVLQRDRIGPQTIPFVRVASRCLYDPDAVFEALKQSTIGGPNARRGSRS